MDQQERSICSKFKGTVIGVVESTRVRNIPKNFREISEIHLMAGLDFSAWQKSLSSYFVLYLSFE